MSERILKVRTSEKGKRLVLSVEGGYTPEIMALINSLPDKRVDKINREYLCRATPAAGWRIMNFKSDGVATVADKNTRLLACFFADSVSLAREHAENNKQQPDFVEFDSWGHQLSAYHFADCHPACLLSMWMGTGKSKVAVDLVTNKFAKKTLILCPVAVLGVWRREFRKFSATGIVPLVLDKKSWGGARKKKEVEKHLELCEARNEPAVIVVNYDTAKAKTFRDVTLKNHWDICILDESHVIKTHNSQVSKYAYDLAKISDFRLCLTGTPMPHSPLDLFGQFRFLDAGIFGTSFFDFRSKYAVTSQMFPSKVLKYINQEELSEKMGLITYQVDQSVLDLPEVIHSEITGEIGKKTRQAYDDLETEMITYIENGGVITAPNSLVKLLRLQQITSGYCVDAKDELVELGNEKIKLLEEILDGVPEMEPVVVFCRFRQDLKNVQKLAAKLKRNYGEISGSRKDLTEDSTMPEGIQVMGVQISSGGVGIDLTRASYGVYYSVGYSLGDYDQSIARIHRPGQKKTTFFYHLVMENTVDEAVYRALDKRRDLVDGVLERLRERKE